ncbi:hypothetical protein Tco_0410291 [Tanacetum coccineum]
MDREALEKDIYERLLILQEQRPIIETLKFIDQHKKLLNSVMLDKLKLDRKVEIDVEESTKEAQTSMSYSYHIYAKLRREEVQPVANKISMLDDSKVEPMGILSDVLCQVDLAKFMILDIPVDKDVPIVMGRSFLYTCGGIINTMEGTTLTFDGDLEPLYEDLRLEKDDCFPGIFTCTLTSYGVDSELLE